MTDSPSPSLESQTTTPEAIAAGTTMGTVSLTVSDLDRSRAFYEGALGLAVRELEDGDLLFGVPGEPALVRLHGDRSAPPLDRRGVVAGAAALARRGLGCGRGCAAHCRAFRHY